MARASFKSVDDLGVLAEKLGDHQRLTSMPCVGERVAAVILSKSRNELRAIEDKLDDEVTNAEIDWLLAARASLSMRLEFVNAALARLDIVYNEGGPNV